MSSSPPWRPTGSNRPASTVMQGAADVCPHEDHGLTRIRRPLDPRGVPPPLPGAPRHQEGRAGRRSGLRLLTWSILTPCTAAWRCCWLALRVFRASSRAFLGDSATVYLDGVNELQPDAFLWRDEPGGARLTEDG